MSVHAASLDELLASEPSGAAHPATATFATFISRPNGEALVAEIAGRQLIICQADGAQRSWWSVAVEPEGLILEWSGRCSAQPSESDVMAALEAAFACHPAHSRLKLTAPLGRAANLLRCGVVTVGAGSLATVAREALLQQACMWQGPTGAHADMSYALRYTLTQGRRHPRRAPKPRGTVYRRYVPWLARTLSLRTIDQQQDLARFNRWMNDPVVAHFWQEEGDLARHRSYLDRIAADPHIVGLIGYFDDEPFGYFEAYWAKEDRIAPFYDADDYDRGWHALVGEARFRGKPYVTAWMPSISHYLFLDDCRTQRIVIEPRIDNRKMIRSLERCGYAWLKEFDFPHKRALLGMLVRERFFGEWPWISPPHEPRASLR